MFGVNYFASQYYAGNYTIPVYAPLPYVYICKENNIAFDKQTSIETEVIQSGVLCNTVIFNKQNTIPVYIPYVYICKENNIIFDAQTLIKTEVIQSGALCNTVTFNKLTPKRTMIIESEKTCNTSIYELPL
jgi:hypothetical protein